MNELEERERRVLASLANDVGLWETAVTFPADCFSILGQDLFLIMREFYIKYGTVISQDALHDKVRKARLDKEQKRGLLKLYYGVKGIGDRSTAWDLDYLKEAKGKSQVLGAISNAVKALTEGVEINGRYYVGLDGAIALMEEGKADISKEKPLSAFEVYMKRKEKKYAVSAALFDPLVTEFLYGEFWMICGFAGDGKTTVALNLVHSATQAGGKALYMTLETPSHVAKWKLASILSNVNLPVIPYRLIKSGNLSEPQEAHLIELLAKVEESTTVMEISIGSRIGEVRAAVRSAFRKYHYDLVVLDYLGLMGTRIEERGAHLNEYIKRFKEVAKLHNTVFLCVHQTNREGWKEAQKKGYYSLVALSDANEAEKTSDGIAWVLKLGFCRTKLGVMKYRDEPMDLERSIELQLELDTHAFSKSITQNLGAVGKPTGRGWDGVNELPL